MISLQVKVTEEDSRGLLQMKLNEQLADFAKRGIEIIDIKYSSNHDEYYSYYSAMIIYKV